MSTRVDIKALPGPIANLTLPLPTLATAFVSLFGSGAIESLSLGCQDSVSMGSVSLLSV